MTVMMMMTGFYSCTKDITLDLPTPAFKYVVEGYIENNRPPYVLLTHNAAFFGSVNANDLGAYFEHGAIIKVWDGRDTVMLTEFCFGSLSDSLKRLASGYFGYKFSDTATNIPNICVYTVPNILSYFTGDSNSVFKGQAKHNYGLQIKIAGTTLTSSTYIPSPLPMQITYQNHSTDPNDSLALIYSTFDEPDTPGNYARTFTQQNSDQMYPLYPQSAFDDKLFNGQHYTFVLQRGQSPYSTDNGDNYGFFNKGDTVTVKFCQIEPRVYDFWHTIESDGGDSPFSSPVKIKSNIEGGGLGVWCGYGAYYATVIIPK